MLRSSCVDDMALDTFTLENAMYPKAIQSSLLDCDDWKHLARSRLGFRLQLIDSLEQSGDVTGLQRSFRHSRSTTRRNRGNQPG